jgi:hypothetical protein
MIDRLSCHGEHGKAASTAIEVVNDLQRACGSSSKPVGLGRRRRSISADEEQRLLQSIALRNRPLRKHYFATGRTHVADLGRQSGLLVTGRNSRVAD